MTTREKLVADLDAKIDSDNEASGNRTDLKTGDPLADVLSDVDIEKIPSTLDEIDTAKEEKKIDSEDSEDDGIAPPPPPEEKKEDEQSKERRKIHERQEERKARFERKNEDRLSRIESALEKITTALVDGKTTETQAKSKIDDLIEKHGLDADVTKSLVELIKEEVGVKGVKVEKKEEKDDGDEDVDWKHEGERFNQEWVESVADISKHFPDASPEQLEEARKLMWNVSHSSDKIAGYELAHIIHLPEFKSQFSELLGVPKKKSFETGTGRMEDSDENFEDQSGPITSSRQAMAMRGKLQNGNMLEGLKISRASEMKF